MQNHFIIAGGPFLTPENMLVMLALLACPVLAFGLFITSLVMFSGRKYGPAAFFLLLSLLFLTPLWGLRSTGRELLIYFGLASAVAVVASACYILFYISRKM